MAVDSIIYKRPNQDCPLCIENKNGRSNDENDRFRCRCKSLAVYSTNKNDAMWVMSCGESHKKCPGFIGHKRMVKAFKKALVDSARKLKSGLTVARKDLEDSFEAPNLAKLDGLPRQSSFQYWYQSRAIEGCLERFGFTKIKKTKSNKKKSMWRHSDEWWYVKRSKV